MTCFVNILAWTSFTRGILFACLINISITNKYIAADKCFTVRTLKHVIKFFILVSFSCKTNTLYIYIHTFISIGVTGSLKYIFLYFVQQTVPHIYPVKIYLFSVQDKLNSERETWPHLSV